MSDDQKRDDGGPAFPNVESGVVSAWARDGDHTMRFDTADGMTLRDYFAGQALSAYRWRIAEENPDGPDADEAIARDCYLLADAMLDARKR